MQTNGVPDIVIGSFLGKGWSYTDWQRETTKLGFTWNEGLRLRIIRREYQLFKSEIGLLLSQPNTNNSLKSRSNSHKSIIKRLKGKTGEREQRLRDGRLFGSEARPHTLENYVKKWRIEDPSFGTAATSSPSTICSTSPRSAMSTLHSTHAGSTNGNVQEDLASSGAGSSGTNNTPATLYQDISSQLEIPYVTEGSISLDDNSGLEHGVEPNLFHRLEFSAPLLHEIHGVEQCYTAGNNEHSNGSNLPPNLDLPMDYTMSNEWYFDQFPDSGHTVALEATGVNANIDELLEISSNFQMPVHTAAQHSQEPLLSTSLNIIHHDSRDAFGENSSICVPDWILADETSLVSGEECASSIGNHQEYFLETTRFYGSEVKQNDLFRQHAVVSHDDTINSRRTRLRRNEASYQNIRHSPTGKDDNRARRYKTIQKETRLRHTIVQLNSALWETRKLLENERELVHNSNMEKDARILELEQKLNHMVITSTRKPSNYSTEQLSSQMQGVVQQAEMLDQILHQQVNDRILDEARRQKQKLLAQKAVSELSWSGTEEEKENRSPHRTRFSSKALVPLRIVPAESGKHVIRHPPRQSSPDAPNDAVVQSISTEPTTSSDSRSRSSSTSTMGSVRRIMRKVSDGIMRKAHRDDAFPPPVPLVPAAVQHQMSEVHSDIKKRLTTDSGYASMLSSRNSVDGEVAFQATSDHDCCFTPAASNVHFLASAQKTEKHN